MAVTDAHRRASLSNESWNLPSGLLADPSRPSNLKTRKTQGFPRNSGLHLCYKAIETVRIVAASVLPRRQHPVRPFDEMLHVGAILVPPVVLAPGQFAIHQ